MREFYGEQQCIQNNNYNVNRILEVSNELEAIGGKHAEHGAMCCFVFHGKIICTFL